MRDEEMKHSSQPQNQRPAVGGYHWKGIRSAPQVASERRLGGVGGEPVLSLRREWRNCQAISAAVGKFRCGVASAERERNSLRSCDSTSIAPAHIANVADDAVASPSQSPAKAPGFLVGGADLDGLLRQLRLLGGAWRRTSVDHETVFVSRFHDDALLRTKLRALPNERVAPTSISDGKEPNRLPIPNQAKNVDGFSLNRKGTLVDRSDWITLSRVSEVMQLSEHSPHFKNCSTKNHKPSFANRR